MTKLTVAGETDNRTATEYERDDAQARVEQAVNHLRAVLEDEPINVSDEHPRIRIGTYGDHECGCSWDSGPYSIYCTPHSPHEAADKFLEDL